MIEKIISGGQTGVDQAALLVAEELGIEIGGSCPLGSLDENRECILERYPSMREAKTTNPDERTRLNIDDSDGTLVIVPSYPLPEQIKDGTRLTLEYTEEKKKPYLIICLNEEDLTTRFKGWLGGHDIKVLNIAGPSESSLPGICETSRDLLRRLIRALQTISSAGGESH